MKLETVKSVILTVLIGISLLLMLALWSYQPKEKALPDMDYAEADLGGMDDLHKKDLINPTSFVFHQYDQVYGFTNPRKSHKLYQQIQDWTMDNLKEKAVNGPPKNNEQIELTFPDQLPMDLADSLFAFHDDTEFPNWSFQRIFITFSEDSSLEVQFLSADENKSATASINDEEHYDQLRSQMNEQDDWSEFTTLDTASLPIYIPKDSPEMKEETLVMKEIPSSELVDALFSNPETVKRMRTRAGEVYYSDGTRGMRVKDRGKRVEYFDPLHEDFEQMDPVDLFETSRDSINEQKGWTDDFYLEALDLSDNSIRYRMHDAGYPVFNHDLSVIEQEWHDDDLYKYKRPLVRFSTQPGETTVELKSGDDVLDYIKDESDIDEKDVENVKPGYQLAEDDDDNEASFYVKMKPAWYLKYKDHWRRLDLDDSDQDKGGS